jgi:recombination protein RecA
MANHALTMVEAALRARKFDRTLTTALAAKPPADAAATSVARLDAALGGGLPRGQLSEIVGARSSGRTALLLQLVAAATRRGEIAALVDTFDQLDVASAAAADVDLDRLLWIRGAGAPSDRAVERALKALNLVLQAGGFGVVAIDLAAASPAALRTIPFTTWLRVQRTIEESDTACVIVGPQPLGRSAGGLTLMLEANPRWSSFLTGFDLAVRVVSARRQVDGQVTIGARMPGCSGA